MASVQLDNVYGATELFFMTNPGDPELPRPTLNRCKLP